VGADRSFGHQAHRPHHADQGRGKQRRRAGGRRREPAGRRGDAAHAADVLKLAGGVRTVFNTHYHLESTGGNDAMAKAGAKIVAHLNTKLWMTQEIVRDWEGGKIYPPRAKEALPPRRSVRPPARRRSGRADRIRPAAASPHRRRYLRALQERERAGGRRHGAAGRLPTLDWFCGGWIGGLQNAQKALLDRADDQTKIVPAIGPVMTKADLQASYATITRIREKLVVLMKKGQGAQNMIDANAVDEFKDVMPGDAATFLYEAYRGCGPTPGSSGASSSALRLPGIK
jgi:glyoxylase-like metal-dependent hydrolase (beta-lactamase superfamily II)